MIKENLNLLQIALPTPLRQNFDYLPTEGLNVSEIKPGIRIKVPFQKRQLVGIFLKAVSSTTVPHDKLKSIIEVLDQEPILTDEILQLCFWASDYYHAPLGEVLLAALPVRLRQGKEAVLTRAKPLKINPNPEIKLILSEEQNLAVDTIKKHLHAFKVFLINGITGSGKTEVYLQVIETVLQSNQQILILVPEIGLTPQTIERFQTRFNVPIIALHSGMSEGARLNAWLYAKSGEAKIIIGTRSAIFTPFADLGLIIIDEEHDLSFKQQDGFRYHARDVAIVRAQQKNIPIVLGSATSSLESLANAANEKFVALNLSKRAGSAILPDFRLVDIRNQTLDEGLSAPLLTSIREHTDRNNQVLLFLNRRGYAPALICHNCGWIANCKRCDSKLTYHHHDKKLHCHYCDAQRYVVRQCENCQSLDLQAIGQGTERIEHALQRHFPEKSIVRIDRDTTRKKGEMEKILSDIQEKKHQILIGTQMLAKGHHFPDVTLVGVLDADGGFFSADFRAIERMGQLILQVAGRSGRQETKGEVCIQTRQPDHPLFHQLIRESYLKFASSILEERKKTQLPPFAFLALFRAEAHKLEDAMQFLKEVKNNIDSNLKNLQIMGPISAPMSRRAGRFRVQLLLHSINRKDLQSALKAIMSKIELSIPKQRVRWSLDVDPLEIF